MKKYPHSLAHVKQNSASKWQFIEFARWAYPITWNGNGANGGHIPPNGTVIEGDQIYIAGSPTRTGHRFEGWFNTTSQSGGHEYTTGAYMPPGNLTLYARWTRNNYTQSFNGNGHTGGTIPGTRTVAYDATSTVPAGPTRTGYTFVGWFGGANGA
ncbi:InlB B-repeat-containing protein, partial [Enterococcus termitis]|uniref:InlB B-repeat-containing protein n=1 Tax=Enterococcus termitis TaxID=332950 RepID=UPI001B80AA0F